jgi:hypothetical protein
MPTRALARSNYPGPEPKPLAKLSRVQLAGRLAATEQAIGLLLKQSAPDGGAVPQALGALKAQAIDLRTRVQAKDRAEEDELALRCDLERAPIEVQVAAAGRSAVLGHGYPIAPAIRRA